MYVFFDSESVAKTFVRPETHCFCGVFSRLGFGLACAVMPYQHQLRCIELARLMFLFYLTGSVGTEIHLFAMVLQRLAGFDMAGTKLRPYCL